MKKKNPGPFYSYPMGIWFSLFFVVPLAIIVAYSFMKRDMFGGVIHEFTLDAYKQMFSAAYAKIFFRTLWMTVVATFISILIALPCGYAIARSRHQTTLLILVIVPFLTNSLIRIFAWMTILGENGALNGICEIFTKFCFFVTRNSDGVFVPHKFMFTKFAVVLVSIYMYLPYAILPIFTSGSIFRVMIPGIKSGIISALIFTFIPIFGNYTVPQIIGSTESYMLGNIIMDQIQKARNLPLASAFSVVLTVVSMAAILFMISSDKKEASLKKMKKD